MLDFNKLEKSIHRYFNILEGKRQCSYCGNWFHENEINHDDCHQSLICSKCLATAPRIQDAKRKECFVL